MKEKIKILKTIHLAICAGVILVYIFAGNITVESLKIPNIDSTSMIYLAIPILALILGNFLFKSQLRQIESDKKLEDSFPVYQTASIIRWAIIEGVAFAILFVKPDFVVFGVLLVAYLIYLMPNEERMKNDINSIK